MLVLDAGTDQLRTRGLAQAGEPEEKLAGGLRLGFGRSRSAREDPRDCQLNREVLPHVRAEAARAAFDTASRRRPSDVVVTPVLLSGRGPGRG